MNTLPLPKRYFSKGERKFVGFRLPSELTRQLTAVAKESGWNITDVVQTALDQYVANIKLDRKTLEKRK